MSAKGVWIEQVDKRTRNGKKRVDSADPNHFAIDATIGSVHYKDNPQDEAEQWKEIDNVFEPAVAPWDWQMLHADYHIRVKEDFTAGQIVEFEKQGETVQFQPMALEWTNDLDMIQQISMPQSVTPVITNPEVDLLSVVGMPSHQGTIRWDDAYGQGIDFEWRCSSTRLVKILEIESFNKLPAPQQYIIDGGNPVLRLNLIFDPSKDVDAFVDGEPWDRKVKKQTFNVIEFRKDGEVLWGFMPLRYWGSSLDLEVTREQSVATLERRGSNLYISIRVPYDWLQNAVYPIFIDVDVDSQVSASFDDCRRRLVSSYFSRTDDYAWAGAQSSGWYRLGCGQRFLALAVDQATTITTAYLRITHYGDLSGVTVNTRVSAEDVDDALTFADSAAGFDTRWAARTSARVEWDGILAKSTDDVFDSPEIKSVIQEIVDRGGWASGQDIVIFWEDFDDRSTHATAAYRAGYTWDRDTDKCSQLHFEYEAPPAPRHGFVNFQDPGIV